MNVNLPTSRYVRVRTEVDPYGRRSGIEAFRVDDDSHVM